MQRIFGICFRFLLILFILALLGSQNSFAQLTHLDSVIAARLGVLLSEQAGGEPFSLVADSGLQSFIAAVPHATRAGRLVQINTFSGTITLRDSSDKRATPILLNARGNWLIQGNPVTRPWFFEQSFAIPLSPADRRLLETNRDRYVVLLREPPSSFWSSIAQPAIVVLGAIAVVALFFLIRS